jgi:two-component system, OmpR family, response regulator
MLARMRVLVVDDEQLLAEGVRRGLQAEGMVVDVANDGRSGLGLARSGGYDVIVLDLLMPGMSGWAVCSALRAEGVWTPVLMLTAKDGEWDQVEAFDAGADDYVTKPFAFTVLVARLRALVRRGAAPRPVLLAAGDLVLDPASRSTTRAGAPVELTARETALLEHLLRNAGRALSKEELLRQVWGVDAGDPNVVEVHMANLRRKIDRPFGTDTIRTVRGAGYLLAADG